MAHECALACIHMANDHHIDIILRLLINLSSIVNFLVYLVENRMFFLLKPTFFLLNSFVNFLIKLAFSCSDLVSFFLFFLLLLHFLIN